MADEPRGDEASGDAENGEIDPVLPVVPEALGIDPLLLALLHLSAFLDLSDDETIDPDAATQALEYVGLYVQRLSDDRLRSISADIAKLGAHGKTSGWSEEQLQFMRDFLFNCGLGESGQREPVSD